MLSDPLGAAGDDGDAAVKPSHCVSFQFARAAILHRPADLAQTCGQQRPRFNAPLDQREDKMAHRFNRRTFLAGTSALAGAAAFPLPSIAQNAPLKIGLMTVKTGPL